MPSLREGIETKRTQEFFDVLGKTTIGGLAAVGVIAIVSGIRGVLFGSSKK
jgi:patatin-like phospholipase/acyl hydrolase